MRIVAIPALQHLHHPRSSDANRLGQGRVLILRTDGLSIDELSVDELSVDVFERARGSLAWDSNGCEAKNERRKMSGVT